MVGEIGSENQCLGQVYCSRPAALVGGPAVRGKSVHFLAMLLQAPAARNEQRRDLKGRGSRLIWVTAGCSLRAKPVRAVGRVSMKGACVKQDFASCVSLNVTFLRPVLVSMKHLMHFHLTRLFVHLRVPNISPGFHGFPGLNGLNGLPGTKGSPGTPGKGSG